MNMFTYVGCFVDLFDQNMNSFTLDQISQRIYKLSQTSKILAAEFLILSDDFL